MHSILQSVGSKFTKIKSANDGNWDWNRLGMEESDISGSQTFDEDWWTMLIESEWTLNQSDEFKVMNSLSTPRPKTKDEHCWYFVPYINIKEDENTYAFNRILVQHGAKLKWEARRMGWYWFPSLNVYGMIHVFFSLMLNHFSVEWKLFSKVYDPLLWWVSVFLLESSLLVSIIFLLQYVSCQRLFVHWVYPWNLV
jgi:hypothetical protein